MPAGAGWLDEMIGLWSRRNPITQTPVLAAQPDPDQAWKALGLVNDWVKHADAKLGATLAVVGVSGGVLFNLIKDQSDPTVALDIPASVCALAAFIAGICAMIGIFPRLRLRRRPVGDNPNPLFFHDIARAYTDDNPGYAAVLHTLTTSPSDLVRHIAHQVHAIATVALRKFRWADRAIRGLVGDLLALGVVALVLALHG